MLILTRSAGEKIRIGADIEVQVVAVKGGQIRIGILAPLDVRVVRSELVDPTEKKPPRPVYLPDGQTPKRDLRRRLG
ncbi:carbon storage regulator [Asticcacaulis sp.]|uniref:carbon storage regulator n=1 Tax=Asticcacaulis sp. TaxID=1872648 RepID=UPI0026233AE7|nr:carbon storage regulator [Asticcacaulis sp.]